MFFITIFSICIAFVASALFGRAASVSYNRLKSLNAQHRSIETLRNRLCAVANPSSTRSDFIITTDYVDRKYNVVHRIYISDTNSSTTFLRSIVKSFPFNDDKDFALLQAAELLDKLNEK